MAKRTGDIELAGEIITPAGASSGLAGEDLSLTAGAGNATTGSGGNVVITAGDAVTNGDGGNITLAGGAGAGAATSGSQEVDVGGARVGGDATGLANDATVYTAGTIIDGSFISAISVTGSAAQTYTALLSELNADTSGGVWSLTSGNLLLTSDTTGSSSTVGISDTDLFSTLTDFVAINAAVAGTGASAGAVIIPDSVAPTDTTNKLYSVGGALSWNGSTLALGSGVFTEAGTNNIYTDTFTGSGDHNFLVLDGAGDSLTTGSDNIMIGENAGTLTVAGSENVLIGTGAGAGANQSRNIAIGHGADIGAFSTDAVVIGYGAGAAISSGDYCIAIGTGALGHSSGAVNGNSNIAIGRLAIGSSSASTMQHNIAMGDGAAFSLTTGDYNTMIGLASGDGVTTGSNNVYIGRTAGQNAHTGSSNNVMIGHDANLSASAAVSNQLVINSTGVGTDDPLIGGDFSTGNVTIGATLRLKERADHILTPAAEYSELWVRNDTPNVLVFTDDAGTDWDLNIAGGISNVVEDTSPQLGGALDGQGFAITDATFPVTINAQTGTSYTAVLTDADKLITLSNAAAIAMTIPANASVAYPIGTKLNFEQLGAGTVTIGITSDTLTFNAGATAVMNGQYSVATALKIAATEWVLFGQLVPAVPVSTVAELSDLTDVNTSTPTNRFALMADGTDFESRALVEADISDLGTYLTDVVGDASPQLGGDLDVNGYAIIGLAGVAATNPGDPIAITAGAGNTTGAGGAIDLTGGEGGATGVGGAVTITGGDGGATSGVGGAVNLVAGEGDTADNNGVITISTGTAGVVETIHGYIAANSTGATALIATIPITSGDSALFEIFAVARQDAGTESAAFRIFGGVENTGGTAALIGSTAKDRTDDGGASIDWDVVAGVSSGNLTITLDNDAETVDWKIKVRLTEL